MSFQPLTQPMSLSSIKNKDSVQTILDKCKARAKSEEARLEVQSYQAEWDRLKSRKNLPRVRRAKKQFRKKLLHTIHYGDMFSVFGYKFKIGKVTTIKPGESFSMKIQWPTKP